MADVGNMVEPVSDPYTFTPGRPPKVNRPGAPSRWRSTTPRA